MREASSPRRRYSRAWTFSARLSFDPIANASVHRAEGDSTGESTTTTIRAGSVAESGGGGAPVAFAFEPLDHDAVARGWRLEPAEGTVQPGDIENVVVTFEPPETVSAGHLAYHGVAEWVETTTTCRLKGGDPAPSEEDGREIVATLRCRLLPPKTEAEKAADAEREAARERRRETPKRIRAEAKAAATRAEPKTAKRRPTRDWTRHSARM